MACIQMLLVMLLLLLEYTRCWLIRFGLPWEVLHRVLASRPRPRLLRSLQQLQHLYGPQHLFELQALHRHELTELGHLYGDSVVEMDGRGQQIVPVGLVNSAIRGIVSVFRSVLLEIQHHCSRSNMALYPENEIHTEYIRHQ